MKAHLQAVQRMFLVVVASAVVLSLVAIPTGDNAGTMAVLSELQAFTAGFDRASLEKQLLEGVLAQGRISIADVAAEVSGPKLPKVTASKSAAPIEPQAVMDLSSLERVHALGQPGASASIATPDKTTMAAAIGWRLADRGGDTSYSIEGVRFLSGAGAPEDLAREQEVIKARATLLEATKAARAATKKHTAADELYRARVKWKAHWKSISRANEKRQEAQAAMDALNGELAKAKQHHAGISTSAKGFKAGKDQSGKAAAAEVTLKDSAGASVALMVPVAMQTRRVPVALQAPGFAATKAAGLWDELKGMTGEQAIERITQDFTWHYSMPGRGLLSLTPLLLVVLCGLLLRRCRGVTKHYNPFNRPAAAELPSVGLGSAPLDLLALVALPLTACVLCAWSLTQIQQLALVPILCGVLSTVLGVVAHLQLRELRDLRDAVHRTHSQAPPAPTE